MARFIPLLSFAIIRKSVKSIIWEKSAENELTRFSMLPTGVKKGDSRWMCLGWVLILAANESHPKWADIFDEIFELWPKFYRPYWKTYGSKNPLWSRNWLFLADFSLVSVLCSWAHFSGMEKYGLTCLKLGHQHIYLYKMDHPSRRNPVFLHLQCIYQNISNNQSVFQFHRREFYWEWIWHSLHMTMSSRTMSSQLLAYYLTILLSRMLSGGYTFRYLLSAKDKIDLKKLYFITRLKAFEFRFLYLQMFNSTKNDNSACIFC